MTINGEVLPVKDEVPRNWNLYSPFGSPAFGLDIFKPATLPCNIPIGSDCTPLIKSPSFKPATEPVNSFFF